MNAPFSPSTGAQAREHPHTIGWLGTSAMAMGGSNQMVFLVGALIAAQGSGAVASGGDPATTNNRMEFTAAIEGLRALPAGSRVCIVTDSRLMLDSMTKWIAGWKRRGWKTAGGDPVKNQDLVLALEAELARHESVRWHWVRGHETGGAHAHKALNDRADRLAVAASHAAAA